MNKNINEVIEKAGLSLMNIIQMGLSYQQWSDEFSYKEIKETYASMKNELADVIGDISSLSADELTALGFVKFSKESDLYLVPLWAFDLIADGTELTCINGEKAIKGQDKIDLDVRFGCIAYGLDKAV